MAKVHDNATDLITFSRSSSGTALRRVGYGENLVDNGEFETDILNWSAVGGGASVAWDSGPQRMQVTAGAVFEGALQTLSLTSGKVYVLSCDYVRGSVSQVRLAAQGFSGQPAATGTAASGSLEVIAVAGVTNNVRVDAGGSTGDFYVDNISVKEVIFDRATDPLVLFNHPDDIPRIEYGSDGALKGLLIEEQRTNLITHSEDTNINYSAEISKQSDAVTWLTGATTADLIVPTTANSQHYFGYSSSYSAGTSNETYSFFAKASGYHRFRVYLANQTGGYQADFDLSAETATNTGAAVGQSIENFGDGWFRCSMTFLSTKGNPYPSVKIFDNSGNETFSGDGTSGIYFAGHQLEAGSFATSYIPTSGSQETRQADVASIPVSAFGYNQQAGTIVVEATPIVLNSGNLLNLNTSGSDATSIYANPNTSGHLVVRNTTTQVNLDAGSFASGQASKLGLAIKENDFAVCLDAGTVASDNSGTLPSPIATMAIGSTAPHNGFCNSHIKSLKYYPRRLTNAQLQELTA